MNILHLKYAVEVEKTRSISKAAENLFMGQPNLSRAIKDLEISLGITIFERSSKAITPTHQGEEFLAYARKIVGQIIEIEDKYKQKKDNKYSFSVSVPRASYISHAFVDFVKKLDSTKPMEMYYKETNSMRAVNNIFQADFSLGIIRYQKAFTKYFKSMFEEKGLVNDVISEFSYIVLMSRQHPLADKDDLLLRDMSGYIEITHGDPFVPSLPFMDAKKAEHSEFVDKRIFVYERGSQFEMLDSIHDTFMWASPIPKDMLDRFGLVQKICNENRKLYNDVLIYRKNYHLTELDHLFIKEVQSSQKQYL